MYKLHPLPVPPQTVSLKPRAFVAVIKLVPPTAITVVYAAGVSGPPLKPVSPALAVMTTPEWS
jgi:hypothetical protein